MAHISADRVRDTSTTTGTGVVTVSGTAPTGFRTLSSVCTTNDTLYYCVAHQTAAEWEVGLGTYSGTNQLTRTTVLASSNSGSAVNFSAGTKDVFITLPASKTLVADRIPMFSAYPAANQNISNSTYTKVQFGTEEFDTNNFFDSVTNHRFQPTIAGYYQVNASVTIPGNKEFLILLYKNGSAFAEGSDSFYGYVSNVSQLVQMNGSTDYLEVFAWHNLGSTAAIPATRLYSVFQAYLVRPT